MIVKVPSFVMKKKTVKEFDQASRIPAWIFDDSTCDKCELGILESCIKDEDIYGMYVVVAKIGKDVYIFHDKCFGNQKVKRWL